MIRTHLVGLLAAFCAGSAQALACSPPLPLPAEGAIERAADRQARLWSRADAVFLSEAGALERIALDGGDGFRATLNPSLALKGELPTGLITIRHTTVTSCGPIPFLDALAGQEGQWFVTFARRLPSGLSVDATIPVEYLVEPDALRAWTKGYEVGTGAPEV